MATTNEVLRTTALEEANKWGSARAAAGAHPGSKDIIEVAETFLEFLSGKPKS